MLMDGGTTLGYREIWKQGETVLEEAGIADARTDSWCLLEFCTGITRTGYLMEPDRMVSPETAARYRSLVERRAQRIPLQHITHQAYFMGHTFYVDEHVLIPRQDTESVVEAALELLPREGELQILDLCTGSGCIVLSLLAERENARGTGTDISKEALDIAQKNAGLLQLSGRCTFLEGDLFEALPSGGKEGSRSSGEKISVGSGSPGCIYDMIVSNPPYIPSADILTLEPEVRLHDPLLALDGSEDGCAFYRRIIRDAGRFLRPEGWLVLEIGHDQAQSVQAMLSGAGFVRSQVKKDLGGNDRAVLAQYMGECYYV